VSQSLLSLTASHFDERVEMVVTLVPGGDATLYLDVFSSGHALGGSVWSNASPGAFGEVLSSFCGSSGTTSGLDGSGELLSSYNLRFWTGRLYDATPATQGWSGSVKQIER
jgi:hypothetical protein